MEISPCYGSEYVIRDLTGLHIVESPLTMLENKQQSVQSILEHVPVENYERWLEPFAGSCVVGMTEQPEYAVFSDIVPAVAQFFNQIKKGVLTPEYLQERVDSFYRGIRKRRDVFGMLRRRFAKENDCLDFFLLHLFGRTPVYTSDGNLSASPGRFPLRRIRRMQEIVRNVLRCMRPTWEFYSCSYEYIFENATKNDLLYADPPSTIVNLRSHKKWNNSDQKKFREYCFDLPCSCMVSLWLERRNERNPEIGIWCQNGFEQVEIPLHGGNRDVLLVRV